MDAIIRIISKWHSKTPPWFRWIFFMPISSIITALLFFPLYMVALVLGAPEALSAIMYSVIYQLSFLIFVFYLIPKKQILCMIILTALRGFFVLFFVAGLIIAIFSPGLDFVNFRELIGELLVLLSSCILIRSAKDFKQTNEEALTIIKGILYFLIFIIIAMFINNALSYLSEVPYIGWFFRIIKDMRDNVMG